MTGEDGLAEFKYVPQGEIGFAEYMPPTGYASDRTPQYATFTDSGVFDGDKVGELPDSVVASDGAVIGLRFADDELKLSVSKRDVTNSDELPGNVLSVYEAVTEGTVGSDGVITDSDYLMELLPCGSYILKEEQAIDGFTIAEDVKFQLNDTGMVQQVTMYNEHEVAVADELVETLGETGTVGMFVLFATLIAMAGAGVYLFRKGRRV